MTAKTLFCRTHAEHHSHAEHRSHAPRGNAAGDALRHIPQQPNKIHTKTLLLLLAFTALTSSFALANTCDSQQLNDPASSCHKSPEQQVQMAAELNAMQHYIQAADLIERLLMQYPQTQGAAEQYQLALAGMEGKHPVAITVQPLKQQNAWQINTALQLRTGYSSNLNQAPSSSSVQLTLPTGPIALNLLPQFQQQGGVGGETLLSANAMRGFANNLQWQIKGDLYGRETGSGGYADYQGTNLLSSLMSHHDNGSETGVAVGFNALHYNVDTYLFASQLMLRHTGTKRLYCKPQTGLDLLWQRQQGNPLLDSHYNGLMVGGLCDTPLGYYSVNLGAGWDWAASQRPGGDQLRGKIDITGIWSTPFISATSFIKATASYQESKDMQAYSPWLNYGATRQLNRLGLGLDYDWPLDVIVHNWRGVASVKWQNQDSNISLFTMNALEGWLGVRTAW
jgi:hypothetical protein